jgi:hypothetical protein
MQQNHKKYTDFLTRRLTIDEAKRYLIELRNTTIDGFSIQESRSLWFSLFIYKFRQENDFPDHLYTTARRYLLDVLSNAHDIEASARHYLATFNDWKKADHCSFVNEVVQYYIDVLHLKESIEQHPRMTEDTLAEWRQSYQHLITTIRDAAKRFGFLSALDNRVIELNRMRYSIVTETMNVAYWDIIEQDLRDKKYDTVIAQLVELKGLIRGIVPERLHADLDDKFDIEYIQTCLRQERLAPAYLVSLCQWVIETMKECDSLSNEPVYHKEIDTWKRAIDELEWPTFIRFSLELCTLLAIDANTRIRVWRSLIDIKK